MNLYHLAFIHFQNLWIFHSYKIHFPLFTSNTFLHTLLSLTLLRTNNQKDICLLLNWHYNRMAEMKKHWNDYFVAQYTHVQHTDYNCLINITKPVETLNRFLQCTSMNIPVDSFPQVLFAMHLYSPLWFLLMLTIFSTFPLVTWPVLTFFQEKFRGRVPAVTLHSFVTFLPSSTVTLCICSKAAGTRRDERENEFPGNEKQKHE